eukprot:SAG31_NODE_366_length_16817_cov_17.317921_9_plen_158_part_00
MELVVDKEMSVDDLRDRLACLIFIKKRDVKILRLTRAGHRIASISGIDADRIALASVKRLQRGEKRRTLTGTVADMEKFAWDWDLLPSAKPEDQVCLVAQRPTNSVMPLHGDEGDRTEVIILCAPCRRCLTARIKMSSTTATNKRRCQSSPTRKKRS